MAHTLTIDLKNTKPVELVDFTNSLNGLADEYKRFSALRDPEFHEDIRLYIERIETGSIIAKVIEMMPYAMPFIGNANTIVEFCENLKNAIEWLKGSSNIQPDIERHTLENISKVIEPVAKDGGAVLTIGNIESHANVSITINNIEANAVQNQARRLLNEMRKPITGYHSNMVVYWYQARNDPNSQRGDRAVIEALWPNPVKTVFATESVKARMLFGTENPFSSAFVVDVQVQSIKDRPVLYTITNFVDILEDIHPAHPQLIE